MVMDRHEHIRRALAGKGARTRLALLLHGLVFLATLALLLLGLGTGLAAVFPLSGPVFFFYGALAWLLCLAALARILAAGLRRWPPERTALLLEARYPDLDGELISTLQLGADRLFLTGTLGYSAAMIEGLQERTDRRLPDLLRRPLADRRRLGRDLAVLGALLAASLGLFLSPGGDWRGVLSVMANPFAARPFARPVIEVTPGDVRLPEGSPLEVRARVRGGLSGLLSLEVKPAGGTAAQKTMAMERRSPVEFVLTVPRVVEPLAYRVVHPRASSPWYAVTVAVIPQAGDLALTLTPPAYSGLPPQRQEGTGHLRCLKGTTVRWQARANKPLAEASLVMGGGQVYPLTVGGGTAIDGEFIVTQGGRYRVVLKDREGLAAPRPDEYDINLIPDEFPTVELVAPREDLEVDQGTVVDIIFAARDDFGLSEANLVYRLESGRTGRIRLPDPGGRRTFQSGYGWDLGALAMQPGQTVVFQVEALDNDSLSGPKAGVSAARSIRIKDARAVHRDLAELEKELVADLTDLLGDELEQSADLQKLGRMESEPEGTFSTALREQTANQAKTSQKFSQSMEKMETLLQRMSQDTLVDPSSLYQKVLARQMFQQALEGEQAEGGQLEELSQMEEMPRPDKTAELSQMAKAKEKRVAGMERALNLLQEAERYQRMEEAVRQQEEAVDIGRDLLDKLEKMKGLDDKAARELAAMLEEISRRMGELARQLSSMQNELPDEFVNADALKDLPLQELAQDLQELAQALGSGDLAGARKKAEELLKKMGGMLNQLKDAARKVQDLNQRARDDFRKKRQGELEQLAAAQRDLLQRSEKLDAELERRLREERRREAVALGELAARTVDATAQKLEALRRSFRQGELTDPAATEVLPEINRRLNELRAAQAAGTPEQMRAALGLLRQEAQRLGARLDELERRQYPGTKEAAAMARDFSREMDQALATAQASATSQAQAVEPAEAQLLQGMSGEQGDLRGKTSLLSERLEKLAQVIPLISPELVGDVKDAAAFMESARGKLERRLPGEAVPDEREALYRLLKAQAAAQQISEQMAKMGELQGGGAGEGEKESLFGLMPSGSSSSPSRGERENGRRGISVRSFRIPGRQEYEVPRIFREEIMESLKAGYPPAFEKAIRQYYRSITE